MGSYKHRVISRVTVVITYVRGLITPLITAHEPPSRALAQPFIEPLGVSNSKSSITTKKEPSKEAKTL